MCGTWFRPNSAFNGSFIGDDSGTERQVALKYGIFEVDSLTAKLGELMCCIGIL